jgi:hypothetical protein
MVNTRSATAILIASIFSAGTVSAQNSPLQRTGEGSGPPQHPVVPLNTNFWSYWTHYWTTWLPDHPVYEMIELTAYENPEDPADYLVRVFLTEREGRKQQYFYLNDEDEVRRTRANAYFRQIMYRRSGPESGPQNLHVEFTDKDSIPIEWTITFPHGATLREHGDGLTPSIHSLGAVLLLALRTRTVDTHDDQVLFAGVDYASDRAPGDPAPGTRSWHNPDYYSAILLFGQLRFQHEEGGVVSNSWGRVFSPLLDDPLTYRTNALGPDNYVEFKLDAAGRMTSYAHVSRGHSLDFTFEPALPHRLKAKDGTSVRFNASFDNRRRLMTGDVSIRHDAPALVVLHWVPDEPEWALGRDFWSVIRFRESGYELTFTGDRPELLQGQR